MSVDIWPSVAPEQLEIEEDATQDRELTWLLTTSLRGTLHQLRHGLEDSYALLAPVDSGSTLVLTTPRHETIKGHVTRVGTRLVRGSVALRLRTLPPLTLTLLPGRPLRLAPLQRLHGLLNGGLDLLGRLCDVVDDGKDGGGKGVRKRMGGMEMEMEIETEMMGDRAPYIAEKLKVLARLLSEASKIIKGSPLPTISASASASASASSSHRPSSSSSSSHSHSHSHSHSNSNANSAPPPPPPLPPPDALRLTAAGGTGWTTHSASLTHFSNTHNNNPPHSNPGSQPPRNLSVYMTIEDASLVLYVRSLEPAGAPMNLGAKLAFAIGTARRIEHDEAERVFRYACDDESKPGSGSGSGSDIDGAAGGGGGGGASGGNNFLGVVGGSGGFLGVVGGGSSRPSSSGSSGNNYLVGGGWGKGGSGSGSGSGRSSEGIGGGNGGGRVSAEVVHLHEGEQETEKEERPKINHVDVYVREKVRVESADPSLLSLSAKLLALSNTLALARRNLAAVMGEELED